MADQLTAQTSKESKGFFNRLKKMLRPGSPSTIAAPTITPLPASILPPAGLVHVSIEPEEAAKLRARYNHFRILIIGRANAGKTTVLKRVCNTNEDPIYNKVRIPVSLDIPHLLSTNRSTRPRRCQLFRISLIWSLIPCRSEGSIMCMTNSPSRATHSSSSTILLVSRQVANRNFRMYSLSYR